MDVTQIGLAVIGAIQIIAVALIKREARVYRNLLEYRREENVRTMTLLSFIARLSIAVAAAIQEGRGNGELSYALHAVRKEEAIFNEFVRKAASRVIVQ